MLALPAASPTTKPVALTLATAGAVLAQVTTRPPSGLPFASFGVAVSWAVPFTGIVDDTGLTATEATDAGITVKLAVPLLPSLVAVIVAEPTVNVWANPAPFTVPTPCALLCQVIVRPVSGLPVASFGVAVNWNEAPTWTLAVAGLTATVATGMVVTVMAAEPILPSLCVVTVTGLLAALPVTSPFASTLATAALPLCQDIERPVSGLPTASCGVALSCTVRSEERRVGKE